jgi:putative acetyltransferase
MAIDVRVDDLSSAEVQGLVAEHLAGMHRISPPGHINALALEGLKGPGITFWSAWRDGMLCGCGALQELDATAGEIKSMRTHPAYLRQGVGQAIVDEIVRTAVGRGYRRLYLETGTGSEFEAAHRLYRRNGFNWCGAYGSYRATHFNVFMVRDLEGAS